MNAVEIEQAGSEPAEQPFSREDFPFQFLAAFGNKDTTLKRLRTGVSNKSDVGSVPSDQQHPHRNLRARPATDRQKARLNLATDVESLEAVGQHHSRFGRRRRQFGR